MKILVISPGKPPEARDIPTGLKELQNIVEGPIEVRYPFDDPVAMICNDEGKCRHLAPNRLIDTPRLYDIICGTFFVVGARPEDEDFSDLPDELILRYTEKFKLPEYFALDGDRILVFHE